MPELVELAREQAGESPLCSNRAEPGAAPDRPRG
jgi:hypothetical protein